MVIDYYDTSALLAKPELIKSNYDNYISHFVIKVFQCKICPQHSKNHKYYTYYRYSEILKKIHNSFYTKTAPYKMFAICQKLAYNDYSEQRHIRRQEQNHWRHSIKRIYLCMSLFICHIEFSFFVFKTSSSPSNVVSINVQFINLPVLMG